ncbi:MAG: glycoside hydrolase 100 family protein, partial [Candidatus Latescibacterota bacterium]
MSSSDVSAAKAAAIEVLLNNCRLSRTGLPRTAAWGYPEPYTRDLMLSSLGILASGNDELIGWLRKVLEALAKSQSPLGHIPGLANDPTDRGSSDTTPLFLIGLELYRRTSGEANFLEAAARKALLWMEYQSPIDDVIVSQQPTSDWRDELWVLGYGLYVNTLVYSFLRLYGRHSEAARLGELMNRFTISGGVRHRHVHEGLAVRRKPYYALWSYKVLSSERFDLVGNSLAILSGIAPRSRAKSIIAWVETECRALREHNLLATTLPPNFFPYIMPTDLDWRPRYEQYNQPGEYHNGGIWPFVCGLYIAAMVTAGYQRRAEHQLHELT